ncbi:hypothetical protein B0H11DRAFT_1906631 [Mycena galericulata]|nr:hypothetical protein B0H11DRAFT_1906631 [Mycena galericulata]
MRGNAPATTSVPLLTRQSPMGLIWDIMNWSCGYNCIDTVGCVRWLSSAWQQQNRNWWKLLEEGTNAAAWDEIVANVESQSGIPEMPEPDFPRAQSFKTELKHTLETVPGGQLVLHVAQVILGASDGLGGWSESSGK